jgi:hypothetical protein
VYRYWLAPLLAVPGRLFTSRGASRKKKEDEHKIWYKNQQYLKNHLMSTASTLQMALLPYHKTRG